MVVVAGVLFVMVVGFACWVAGRMLVSVLERAEADAAFVRRLAERAFDPPDAEVDSPVEVPEERPVDLAGQPMWFVDPLDAEFPDGPSMENRDRAVALEVGEPFGPAGVQVPVEAEWT